MAQLRFIRWDKRAAYRRNWLRLPKKGININLIKAALEFKEGAGTLYAWRETATHLLVPRSMFTPEEIRQRFSLNIIDLLPPLRDSQAPITSNITLRETALNQQGEMIQAAERALRSSPGTILEVGCGKGKTPVALELATRLQVRTLVIIVGLTVLKQWVDSIRTFLPDQDPGIVRGAKCQMDRTFSVASLDTIASQFRRWPPEYFTRWGLVIFDEVHSLGGARRSIVGNLFPGRRLGLTATLVREDGRQPLYLAQIGPVCYRAVQQELSITAFFHLTPLRPPPSKALPPEAFDQTGAYNYPLLCNWLDEQEERTTLILRLLHQDLREGRKILVLSKTLLFGQRLAERLGSAVAVNIHHGIKPNSRVALIRDSSVAICTERIGMQSLDDAQLDTLYIVHPFKSLPWLIQGFGRIQRTLPEKSNILVRVIEDPHLWPSKQICRKARKVIAELGYLSRRIA